MSVPYLGSMRSMRERGVPVEVDAAAHRGRTGRFGRFQLIEHLGTGAMGAVHRALDSASGAEVALKVLALPLAALSDADRRTLVSRFAREARLAGAIEHPGIVRVLDSGEAEGVPWISMELVRGETLFALISRRRGPALSKSDEREPDYLRRVAALMAEAADAVD